MARKRGSRGRDSRSGGRRGAGKGGKGFLGREQQKDLIAVGLIALAAFVLLALVPLSLLGERAPELFPSGNAMGVVGRSVDELLVTGFGGAAVLIPVMLALAGLASGGWLAAESAVRLLLLSLGLLVLLPVLLYVLAPDPGWGGRVGEWLGLPLVTAVSWLGATLLLGVLLIVLCVVTVRWNPLRTVGAGVATGGGVVRGGLEEVARRIRAVGEARARAKAQREAERLARAEGDVDEAYEAEPFAPESPPPDEDEGVVEAADGDASPEAVPAEPDAEVDDEPEDPLPDPHAHAPPGVHELPPLDLLTLEDGLDRQGMERELDRLGQVLVEKLRTFNVESELGGRTTGPMVTQFEVVPAPGVKVNRIANLDADLALAMKAQSIRIVAPIPGKGAVGVEIPNPEPEIVYLREILQSREFQKARGHLPLALGKDLNGRPYVADLAKMPHALIAGATGSGKSVCINTIVTSLMCKHTPDTLRLLMVDPKMVELSAYADLPHLRHPVVTDPRDAAGVLKWAVFEMERRYQLLSANGVRSIAEFNKRVRDDVPLKKARASSKRDDTYRDGVLPYVVVVVDELADLMMTVQAEVEKPLAQLAQKARAIGIHLIVATQRPSVNVITGLIKANFPTRIAFRVASKTDSRTILDQNGAEALLGNGDMLFLPPGGSEPVRIQGAYLATEDTDALLSWYRSRKPEEDDESEAPVDEAADTGEPDILEELRSHEMEEASSVVEEIKGDWDELFRAAAEVCVQNQGGSTSLLQRRLKIGYGRAARIVDQLQEAGILGPQDGSKPREVLVSLGELDSICGPG